MYKQLLCERFHDVNLKRSADIIISGIHYIRAIYI